MTLKNIYLFFLLGSVAGAYVSTASTNPFDDVFFEGEKFNADKWDKRHEEPKSSGAAAAGAGSLSVSPPDLTLVIGSNPREQQIHDKKRTFYTDPHIYTLSDEACEGDAYDTRRYSQVNFTNLDQLKAFAEANRGKFTTLCFDYSVFKFFMIDHAHAKERIECFRILLKPDGVLYLPNPESNSGGSIPSDPKADSYRHKPLPEREEARKKHAEAYRARQCEKTIKRFNEAGFSTEIVNSNTIENTIVKIIPLAHPALSGTAVIPVLVAKPTSASGGSGSRRKSRSRSPKKGAAAGAGGASST